MPEDKAIRKTKERGEVRDSEGLRVSTTQAEEPAPEESVNAGAKEAFDAEVAEAKAAADEEAKKREEFEKFLAEQAK